MRSIYLVGFMGSGKTSVGQLLAKNLGYPFIDTDKMIVESENKDINAIFENEGENYFREKEAAILKETNALEGVISTGGGIIEREDNRLFLKEHTVVFLSAEWSTIVERLADDNERPIWRDGSRDKERLYQKRLSLYQFVSTLTIDTDGLSPIEIVEAIIHRL